MQLSSEGLDSHRGETENLLRHCSRWTDGIYGRITALQTQILPTFKVRMGVSHPDASRVLVRRRQMFKRKLLGFLWQCVWSTKTGCRARSPLSQHAVADQWVGFADRCARSCHGTAEVNHRRQGNTAKVISCKRVGGQVETLSRIREQLSTDNLELKQHIDRLTQQQEVGVR